ncbi:MAG: HNH endonuclease [Alphaproteobacteria bacterium]
MKRFFSYCLILLHTLANARVFVPMEEISATKTSLQAANAATIVGTVNHQGNVFKAVEDLGKPTALKSVATAIATAGLVGPAPEGGIFSANFAENLATHGVQHLGYGLQAGAVSFAINGGSAKDALKTAGLLAASSAVQASVGNELGVLRKAGLDSVTHKIGHALAGAAAGAILDPKNPGKGAAAGALGSVIGEVVAEALPESLTRETRADYGKIAAATGALLSKQDVPTAIATADTALQNNWLLTGAIGGGLAVAANTEEGQKVLAEIEGATQAALEKERAVGFENLNEAEQFLVGAYHTGVIKDFAYRELDAITNGKLSLVNEWVSSGIQWTGEVASDALKSLNANETLASHGAAFTVGALGAVVPSKAQALAAIGKTGKTLTGPIKISRVEKEVHPRVRPINNQKPKNYEYAGNTYPLEKLPEDLRQKYPHSVPFTGTGHPDFSRYATKKVKIKMTGDRTIDKNIANKFFGFEKTPDEHTWHHHHDGQTMVLIPEKLHKAVNHTGGVAIVKGKQGKQ